MHIFHRSGYVAYIKTEIVVIKYHLDYEIIFYIYTCNANDMQKHDQNNTTKI